MGPPCWQPREEQGRLLNQSNPFRQVKDISRQSLFCMLREGEGQEVELHPEIKDMPQHPAQLCWTW